MKNIISAQNKARNMGNIISNIRSVKLFGIPVFDSIIAILVVLAIWYFLKLPTWASLLMIIIALVIVYLLSRFLPIEPLIIKVT